MKSVLTMRMALFALSLVAASTGMFVYWQVGIYPKLFNNIAFIFAYALALIFISTPLLIFESVSGFLSKKPLIGSLHYASRSQRLHFIGVLSMALALILLALAIARASTISSSLVYTSFWYATGSAEETLRLIDYYTLPISITFNVIVVIVIALTQNRARFLKLVPAFSILGLTCLVILLAVNAVTFDTSTSFRHFFIPDFQLLSSIDVWESAIELALFSGLIGLGINSVIGVYFKSHYSIYRFSWIFVISCIVSVVVIMLLQMSYKNGDYTVPKLLDFQSAYTLNLLAFGMFFFCLLSVTLLLCQTLKSVDSANSTHQWYMYLPFFILLLAAAIIYQHVLANKVHEIIQIIIIDLIFIIAYGEILAFGWICDAQRLSYQLYKTTKIKLPTLYNLSLRLIAPSAILTAFLQKILNIWITPHWILIIGIFIISAIFTVIFGNFLHRRFQ